MILKEKITIPIAVISQYLDKNVDEYVIKKCKEMLYMKCLKELGIVINISNNKPIVSEGKIQLNGICKYNVTITVTLYKPIVGEKINCIVGDVGLHGFYASHGPISDIFIAYEKKPNIEKGDKIIIEITKSKFSEDKFIVLGKHIKKKKKNED